MVWDCSKCSHWQSYCLVPVRRLSRPSRSMSFFSKTHHVTRHAYAALSEEAKGPRKTISGIFSTGIALSLSYLAFMAILAKSIMGLLWRRIPYATSHNRELLLSGLEIKKYKYVCQNITKTRIAERRFLTGLPRGYFFLRGSGGYTHSGRPLRETESHVRLKHKLFQNIVPFWKTFATKKNEYHF